MRPTCDLGGSEWVAYRLLCHTLACAYITQYLHAVQTLGKLWATGAARDSNMTWEEEEIVRVAYKLCTAHDKYKIHQNVKLFFFCIHPHRHASATLHVT